MPNEILLDNDFLVKISSLDLIDEFLALPYVRAGILRHLDTLPSMIKKGRLKNYSEEGLRRAMFWMESFQSIEAPSHSFIDSIPAFPGIDPGERLLLASVLEVDEANIFTGDKRCINALGSIPSDMIVSFHHKVICLEAAIRAIIELGDFEYFSLVLPYCQLYRRKSPSLENRKYMPIDIPCTSLYMSAADLLSMRKLTSHVCTFIPIPKVFVKSIEKDILLVGEYNLALFYLVICSVLDFTL